MIFSVVGISHFRKNESLQCTWMLWTHL